MKKSTPWITIPDETLHTPASSGAGTPRAKQDSGSVRHKFFWGVGFVAVVIVSFAMLAPQQFGAIIQGNLFEATGVESPTLEQDVRPLSVLPARTTEERAEETVAAAIPEARREAPAVQPETTPVTIEIQPLTAEPAETDEEELSSEAPAIEVPETDPNRRLIEELQKQVADLKAQQAQVPPLPDAAAPDLMSGLRSVAPVGGQAAPEAAGVTATLGQPAPYRTNPHRVTVHPQVVLEQHRASGTIAFPPGTTGASRQPMAPPRTDFAQVHGTPESGPKEVLSIALILTFFGLLGWKALRPGRR